ncbi:hypothetical protein ACIQ6V_32760 [Streptomyces sp. NPDC096198]|uniref:hypothetical protein n=1 Tax=Streptomyces sp. NPDC096198 TaxID=3366080 RepID=UPI0037F20962
MTTTAEPDAGEPDFIGTGTPNNEDTTVSTALGLLPLRQDDGDEPRFKWATRLMATEVAGPNARLRARPRLTVAHWPGNVDAASRVADKLVDNAVQHGKSFGEGIGWVELRLIVLSKSDDLIIEVDDASPGFPGFEYATTAEAAGRPPGLWWVRHYQGTVSWHIKTNSTGTAVGKTVRALVPAREEAA